MLKNFLLKVKYYQMATNEFTEWLEKELRNRGWRPADLAHRARVNTGTISNILNGFRRAGPDVCLAIARALKVPPEEVFRRAGLLPPLPAPVDDATLKELEDIVKKLDPEERQEVLEYARWRYRRKER